MLHSSQPAFNGNLYLATATVIPILFVALMLPGGVLARYSVWTKNVRSLMLGRIYKRDKPPNLAVWAAWRVHDLLRLPVMAFLVLFLFGEYGAMSALANRHPTAFDQWMADNAVIIMALIAFASSIAASAFEWSSKIGARKGPERPAAPTRD